MTDQRWLTPAEMAAWLAFLDVSHRLDRVIEQQLRRDAGLSHAQYEILSRLESAPGGQLRMSDLADVIIVSRSGLTYQVTQLQKAGLVRRAKSPSDDRGVLAILTPDGRAALLRAAPGHLRVVREYLIDALTPAQLAALTDALSAARPRLHPPTNQPSRTPSPGVPGTGARRLITPPRRGNPTKHAKPRTPGVTSEP